MTEVAVPPLIVPCPECGSDTDPGRPGITDVLTSRPIGGAEARAAAQRLVNSHFGQAPEARIGVPARPDDDDDLVLLAYIEQREAVAAAHDHRVSELLAANNREVERRREAEAEIDRLRGMLRAAHILPRATDCTSRVFTSLTERPPKYRRLILPQR